MKLAIELGYLAAASLFVLGLKGLSHPRTAVRGNFLGAAGMALAVALTMAMKGIGLKLWVWAGLATGAAVGTALALGIRMTAVPQLVALFNGFGGGASALVAGAALFGVLSPTDSPLQLGASSAASGIIGAVTFWGSLVAFGKLQGLLPQRPIKLLGHTFWLALAVLASFSLAAGLTLGVRGLFWPLLGAASLAGLLLVFPVGGADMPVVISFLNALSGLAAAATGFVLANEVLIISGSLVGASGTILTGLMCRAMNRSLGDVLAGRVAAGQQEDIYAGRIKTTDPEEVAMLLEGARRVVIVPGYGMAVAQAQFALRDLFNLLNSRGIEVEFGIHPVAGRMPGHMNVLLAEADIPYDRMKTLEEINPTFPQTDVALVVGANDVVNPAAREADSGPLAGMPILDVDKARTVVVVKRSLSPGFAGVPNPLFAAENTLMLFGDAKERILEIVRALKG